MIGVRLEDGRPVEILAASRAERFEPRRIDGVDREVGHVESPEHLLASLFHVRRSGGLKPEVRRDEQQNLAARDIAQRLGDLGDGLERAAVVRTLAPAEGAAARSERRLGICESHEGCVDGGEQSRPIPRQILPNPVDDVHHRREIRRPERVDGRRRDAPRLRLLCHSDRLVEKDDDDAPLERHLVGDDVGTDLAEPGRGAL